MHGKPINERESAGIIFVEGIGWLGPKDVVATGHHKVKPIQERGGCRCAVDDCLPPGEASGAGDVCTCQPWESCPNSPARNVEDLREHLARRCSICVHPYHVGQCPAWFLDENGPVCGCYWEAAPLVIVRPGGGHWHVSTRCPMVDSAEYELHLPGIIEERDLSPCGCVDWKPNVRRAP